MSSYAERIQMIVMRAKQQKEVERKRLEDQLSTDRMQPEDSEIDDRTPPKVCQRLRRLNTTAKNLIAVRKQHKVSAFERFGKSVKLGQDEGKEPNSKTVKQKHSDKLRRILKAMHDEKTRKLNQKLPLIIDMGDLQLTKGKIVMHFDDKNYSQLVLLNNTKQNRQRLGIMNKQEKEQVLRQFEAKKIEQQKKAEEQRKQEQRILIQQANAAKKLQEQRQQEAHKEILQESQQQANNETKKPQEIAPSNKQQIKQQAILAADSVQIIEKPPEMPADSKLVVPKITTTAAQNPFLANPFHSSLANTSHNTALIPTANPLFPSAFNQLSQQLFQQPIQPVQSVPYFNQQTNSQHMYPQPNYMQPHMPMQGIPTFTTNPDASRCFQRQGSQQSVNLFGGISDNPSQNNPRQRPKARQNSVRIT